MRYFQSLSLINTMAAFKLKSEASRLVFSYFWWIIEPILFVAMYYTVFSLLLDRARGVDFIFFLMAGKVPFLWFSKTVNSSANSLIAGKAIMSQRDFPKHVFPFVVVQQNFYKQIAVFVLLLLALVVWGYRPSLNWLYFPVIVFSNYLLILLVSMLSSLLVVYLRDMRMIISMGTTFLMFSSGIFWDIRTLASKDVQELIFIFNPLAYFLDEYRQVLLRSQAPDLTHLVVLTVVSLFFLFLVHKVLKIQSQFIARRVIS